MNSNATRGIPTAAHMTNDENNPSPPFHIAISGKVAAEVASLAAQADTRGKKKAFLLSLRKIVERLRANPYDFGECRYRLPSGKMPCHIGAIQPAAVHFAIHEESSNVILLRVFLMGS